MTRTGRSSPARLIVMTRYPQAGQAKTRLVPVLGDPGAAALHAELARYCVRRMHAASLFGDIRLEVHATGAPPSEVRRWLGRKVGVRAQAPGDLGDRLSRSARGAIATGAPAVVIVGSDAPDLGGAHVRAALDSLARHDVVLGPATDGGYYLVGVRAPSAERAIPALFDAGIPWSTADVLEATMRSAARAGLHVHLLETLPDIDRPEDLRIWERVCAERERTRVSPRLSVVIPTLNEEGQVVAAVRSAREAGADEVVVADGGSTDSTTERAAGERAMVVTCVRGRARQLNAGAAAATGDVLLFLHADTRLPIDACAFVRDVLEDPDVAIGSFRFAAGDPSSRVDRLISAVGAWRHALFRLPYGDQAQFVRAQDFVDAGGYPDIPVMEDYEFALRFARLGRIGVAPCAARTSARAWHDHGLARTTLTNAAVIAGYRAGVAPKRLAAWRARIATRIPVTGQPRASAPDRSGPPGPP